MSFTLEDDDFAQTGIVAKMFLRRTPEFFLENYDLFDCQKDLEDNDLKEKDEDVKEKDKDLKDVSMHAKFFRLETHHETQIASGGYTSKMWTVIIVRILRKAKWIKEKELSVKDLNRLRRLVFRAALVQKFNSFALLAPLEKHESENDKPFDAIGTALYIEVTIENLEAQQYLY